MLPVLEVRPLGRRGRSQSLYPLSYRGPWLKEEREQIW
jgi:hypothetical protein